ncbi:hypothetical protein NDU88_003847 [Pleurodeles waltl]|uniref:Uncharacterized protein n=1 Tax=Pleurodeles waltl TaxID=8319 RepID=A0AAV7LPA0_PLEWA|nr:hypothetical protein NDU88_003847 [Pleurodeles waltl]
MIIEELIKELEGLPNQEEVNSMITSMEERFAKQKNEIRTHKAHKFNCDRLDYEYGRIYTFARKYETLRTKEQFNTAARSAATVSSTDLSSDPGSSADETPQQKLDFMRK